MPGQTGMRPVLAAVFVLGACATQEPPQPVTQLPPPKPAPESPLIKNKEVTLDDTTVATNVRAALKSEPMLKDQAIGVQCQQGIVQLTGAVKSPDDRQRAEGVAREVAGVKEIDNKIELVR